MSVFPSHARIICEIQIVLASAYWRYDCDGIFFIQSCFETLQNRYAFAVYQKLKVTSRVPLFVVYIFREPAAIFFRKLFQQFANCQITRQFDFLLSFTRYFSQGCKKLHQHFACPSRFTVRARPRISPNINPVPGPTTFSTSTCTFFSRNVNIPAFRKFISRDP